MTQENPKLAKVRALPLHRYFGVEGLTAQDGESRLRITVTTENANPAGVLHGGVIYALCDVAAYAALLSVLPTQQEAATHDLHVSVMRPAPLRARVTFSGHLARLGKRLAFLDAEARVEDRIIATARVTKSLFEPT